MHRQSLIAATLLWLIGCTLDAPVVGERTGGPPVDATVRGEFYGDWCVPPAYDPLRAPQKKRCTAFPQTDYTIYSATERATRWAVTIVFDRSRTMNDTLPGSSTSKWESLKSAIRLLSLEPTGFLHYLTWIPFAADDTDSSTTNCSQDAYRNAESLLQTVANINVTTISNRLPESASATLRPTAAALLAAVRKTRQTADYDTSHTTVPLIVLITDGPPEGCGDEGTLDSLVATLHKENSPSSPDFVPVHVIQLGSNFDLESLAAAGGTTAPHIVQGGRVDYQLVWILRHVLYPVTNGCTLSIDQLASDPTAKSPSDFEMVIESPYTERSLISPPHLSSAAACNGSPSGGFWVTELAPLNYLVELCPCTCGVRGTFHHVQVFGYCND